MTIESAAPVLDVVDVSKQLCGHSFTTGWLLDSLRANDKVYRKLHGDRPVKDVTAFDISGGKGFVSIVLRCSITFVDALNASDCYTTILKIPGFDSMKEATEASDFKDEDMLNDQNKAKFVEIHHFECDFYNILAPLLDAPVPKVYKTENWILEKKEGCLHMEDLTLRGKTILYFENISLTQVKSYIRHLARMHKNFLCTDSKIWKGKFSKNQDGFVEFLDHMGSAYGPFLEKCKREKEFRPIIEKYAKLSMSKEFYLHVNKQAWQNLGLAPVFVQGDMHPGNIMWAIDENGDVKQELAAIIDWQTAHEGSPMEDLARFLSHCADGVVRRQAEAMAFDYYHKCLTAEFGGDATRVPYTVELLRKAYDWAFIPQAFFTVVVLTFFLSAIENKIPTEELRSAYFDHGVLKSLHCLEDADRLLKGEFKDVYHKYGL